MKPSLVLKMGQQLTMTPQLQQAIRLLQLPVMELQTQILDALEQNIMLEVEETPANETAESTETSETTETPAENTESSDSDEREIDTRADAIAAEVGEGLDDAVIRQATAALNTIRKQLEARLRSGEKK